MKTFPSDIKIIEPLSSGSELARQVLGLCPQVSITYHHLREARPCTRLPHALRLAAIIAHCHTPTQECVWHHASSLRGSICHTGWQHKKTLFSIWIRNVGFDTNQETQKGDLWEWAETLGKSSQSSKCETLPVLTSPLIFSAWLKRVHSSEESERGTGEATCPGIPMS